MAETNLVKSRMQESDDRVYAMKVCVNGFVLSESACSRDEKEQGQGLSESRFA